MRVKKKTRTETLSFGKKEKKPKSLFRCKRGASAPLFQTF